MKILRKAAARLSDRWQRELKRIKYSRQISNGTFISDEPEYQILDQYVDTGDWVLDIGANVGHYTKRLSELVGETGRVLAFEPVPATFSLLSSNALLFNYRNVTLINSAISDKLDVVGMVMPEYSTGLTNYYQAHMSSDAGSALSVLTLALDSFNIDQQITLVKIDTEGHEITVLNGMKRIIERWHPILIIETSSKKVIGDLTALGYNPEKLQKSPNVLFIPDCGTSAD